MLVILLHMAKLWSTITKFYKGKRVNFFAGREKNRIVAMVDTKNQYLFGT